MSVDTEVLPTLHAEDVTSLISDSGVTRYRLHAKIWDMYSEDSVPYWYFPEKIHLEKFDSLFNIEGSIEADTAYFFEKEEIWKLVGNVHVQNLQGHKFDTEELYWYQKEPASSINSIRTDKFIRIDLGDRIITSEGLRSNQAMTNYRLYASTIEAIINESSKTGESDSIFVSESPENIP